MHGALEWKGVTFRWIIDDEYRISFICLLLIINVNNYGMSFVATAITKG